MDKQDLKERFGFTGQQSEIAARIYLGKSNKEIAADLFIQVGTVKYHITTIYQMLGVKSRSEAMLKLGGTNDLPMGMSAGQTKRL